ncbi:helix-turn-helix domain protein [Clostridium tepidiprofundi DSM 19306]|uniref:Helix-turn-helix domain protein n=1 Tax=Clostridium tepidiprofundi DSM 19306 TaxID=1121338 RepID=A0A151B602_9CLOT|nr:helix-turn-helix domain-containing protein [Clostridium tepidiprofundi]KYH35378.1 helix-turn-helix domain protein [Clostridium tepidiprofundi DSM 19306]
MSKVTKQGIEVFTVGETAKILKSNTNTVYKLIREGKIQALKLGRLKVPAFEIERFLHDNLGQDLSEYIC